MLNENPVNMFFDSEMDKQMVRDGYLVLPFLDKDELLTFKDLYDKWHPEHPNAFYKSYFDPRMDYKQEVEQKIIDAFVKKMSGVFRNYNAFGGLFVVKPPTQQGHLPPHQDWSFVDERKYWSINMWCPLEDVNDTNGNILVLKGSHQFNRTIRGVGTPDVYRDYWKLIERNMKSIPMKAGEAIFFFHGLLHGSTLNTTDKSRVSIGLTLTPKDAPHYFHFKENDRLERFETTPDFYIEYAAKRGGRPDGKSEFDSFQFEGLSREHLVEQIKESNGSINLDEDGEKSDAKVHSSWFDRLKRKILIS